MDILIALILGALTIAAFAIVVAPIMALVWVILKIGL
jgi:hypothetical protein